MSLRSFDAEQEYSEITRELAEYVYARDGDLCQVTGERGGVLHHVLFKSQGGKNCANNLVLLSTRGHLIQHGLIKGTAVSVKVLRALIKTNEERLKRSFV